MDKFWAKLNDFGKGFLMHKVNYLIKGLVIALPLFFLPWTVSRLGMDNFNKQYLLWIIVPLVLFLFIFKMLRSGRLKFNRTPLDAPIIIYLSIVGLAVIFSLDWFSSLFGCYGNITLPYLGLISLILLYFFIVNYITRIQEVIILIKLIIINYIIIVLVAVLLFFGFISDSVFSYFFRLAVGSLEDAAMFIAVMDVLLLAVLANKERFSLFFIKQWSKILVKIVFVLSLLLLILINFTPAWWSLLIGSITLIIAFVIKGEPREQKDRRNLIWPILVIFLIVNCLFTHYLTEADSLINNRYAQKLQLDYNNSLIIAKQALKQRPILGYGPDTFGYVFSLFKNFELNNTEFWSLRFNKSYSYILNLSVTTGILGILSYLFFICALLYFAYKFFKDNKVNRSIGQNNHVGIAISLIAVILALVVGQFLYSINITLLFLFWLFLGLFMACWRLLKNNSSNIIFREYNFSPDKNSRLFQAITAVIFLFFVGWIILVGLGIKYWIAEIYFKNSGNNEEKLAKAVVLNPYCYNYRIGLAKFYLNNSLNELVKKEVDRDLVFIQDNINKSINLARQAINIAPHSVAVHETLGMIYRNISFYSPESNLLAIEPLQNASRLEPSNPVLAAELGNAYMDSGLLEKAIVAFKRAADLKDDYFEPKFNLAELYARTGEETEALAILSELENKYRPADVYYEQGKIYFNQKKFKQAINKFRQVIGISPNHANALYSLALALEAVEDKEQALYYFEKVLNLNLGNIEVMKKIEALKKQ